jgi:hypothetical protein
VRIASSIWLNCRRDSGRRVSLWFVQSHDFVEVGEDTSQNMQQLFSAILSPAASAQHTSNDALFTIQ